MNPENNTQVGEMQIPEQNVVPVQNPVAPPVNNAGAMPAIQAQPVQNAGGEGAGNVQGGVAPAEPVQNTTQSSLLISEIRDNMVIMKDGSFRAIVACKSINFDLMSAQEREGVEYSYQNFLNSLHFTVQILIRSQRIDIGPYLDRLAEIRRSQDNMLLNVLMDDYINFIDVLSQEANIMDKSFFIVIPYYTVGDAESMVKESKNIFKKIFSGGGQTVTRIDRPTFDKAVTEVGNRVDTVINGLFQIGVQSTRLNTRELGQLYYNFNNPDTAVREPLGNFEDVTGIYVKKGEGEAMQPHLKVGGM